MEIVGLKTGNVEVYEALFRLLYEPLCHYAYSILHNREDAEDMVQKTFCMLWEKRKTLDIHSSTKSYLYRMVHNGCLNKIRQTQIHFEHHEQIAYSTVSAENNVENTMTYKELRHRIEMAVAALPERCRQVFLLSRMQNLSYLEIAQEMNISHNTVETQMVKALKTLRIQLKEYLLFALSLFLNW